MFEKFKQRRREEKLRHKEFMEDRLALDNLIEGVLSGKAAETQKIFQEIIEKAIKEELNRNNPFWH